MEKLEDNQNLLVDICISLPGVVRHEQCEKVTLDDGKKRTENVGEVLEN